MFLEYDLSMGFLKGENMCLGVSFRDLVTPYVEFIRAGAVVINSRVHI